MRNRIASAWLRGRGLRPILVTDEDVAAARRLLALVADESSGGGPPRDRRQLVEDARWVHGLRQRRLAIFGESFIAEPPFAILLGLYANEPEEGQVTVTRLAQLAWTSPTSTLRWLEELVRDGWLVRLSGESRHRGAKIMLSAKARSALDRLFSWSDEPDGL
jgi:DNA-binding MarR family transcriptional regulator